MKFKLTENLEFGSPYMLNKDGEAIRCGIMHPYIKYIIQNPDKREIEDLFNKRINDLKWFYDNIRNQQILDDLNLFINLVINTDYFDVERDVIREQFDVSEDQQFATMEDICELFNALNRECNQEFCKVRTSHMRFGGSSNDVYFRISSVGFNWFNIIWQFVYENKNWISSVTITSDPQALGGITKTYKHNNQSIYQLPTSDFITLSGNPIIEKYKQFDTNKSLCEIFYNLYPGHLNNQMRIFESMYMEDYFGEEIIDANTL